MAYIKVVHHIFSEYAPRFSIEIILNYIEIILFT